MIHSLASVGNSILAVAFILGSCILVHELGHFVTARLARMRVEEFMIGFPPRIASFVRGGTRYGIGLIIFGGFVRIAGMEPGQEQVEGGFYTRPRLSQVLVLLSGSVMNVLLAVALFALVGAVWGTDPVEPPTIRSFTGDRTPARQAGLRPGDQIVALDGNRSSLEIATVAPGSVAQRLGLQVGDTVLGVNDDEVALPSELIRRVRAAPGSVKLTVSPLRGEPRAVDGVAEKLGIPRTPRPGESLETLWGARFAPVRVVTTMIYVSNRPGERITLGVRRRGVETPVTVVPEKVPARKQVEDASGKTREVAAAIGRIGVKFAAHPSPLGKAVGQGFRSSAGIVVGVVNMLWTAVRGKAAFEVGGPVLIVATAVEQARVGWDAVLQLCGLISVNLGILNLLPIPITDGGRLSLCLYEAIVGRRVSKQREIAWLLAGMVLFIVLFLTITFKDVFSLVTSRAP